MTETIEASDAEHDLLGTAADDLLLLQSTRYPHDTTIAFNASNLALTQYCAFRFNSFAVLDDGILFGADGDRGVFEFDGADTDDNSEIQARFRTKTSDMGGANQKRIRSAYLGAEATGDLLLIVRNDESNSREYTFSPENTTQIQRGQKLFCGRDGKGRYWDFEVQNVFGSDFSVDQIDAVMIVLGRKPSGS